MFVSTRPHARLATGLVALAVAVVTVAPAGAVESAVGSPPGVAPHASDHIIVKLDPGADPDVALGKGSRSVFGAWRTVPVPPGRDPVELVAQMRSRPGVETAELDFIVSLDPGQAVPLGAVSPLAVNDPFIDYQWHFPAIQVQSAWTVSTGAGVVVAIVDTGISQDGEDLLCQTFVSPYNAITGVPGAAAATDDQGHGTHVAGTVAQCTDNGVGVAGVAFDASLMPVKVLNSAGDGLTSDIAEGIDWARTHGADVINLSLGCFNPCETQMLDQALDDALAAGVVVVAASGNDSDDVTVDYPARHPGVIAVGATDYVNARAPYSNGGSKLDLVAPGGDLTKDLNFDGYGDGVVQETFVKSPLPTWGYYFFNGTSMAAPHVSAAAALLLAHDPDLDPAAVEQILEGSALDVGPPGFDTSYGNGLVQIYDALTYDYQPPRWKAQARLFVKTYGETSLQLAWKGATDNVGVTGYELGLDGSKVKTLSGTTTTLSGLQPGTPYAFDVMARDARSNWSEPLAATLRTARHFVDTSDSTFFSDILWMSGMDITRGCNPPANDMFCPDDPVTRAQFAAFMVRALGLKLNTSSGFTDVPGSSTFAEDIGRLATAGVTKGCNPPDNDMFCPDSLLTRGQLAAFFARSLG